MDIFTQGIIGACAAQIGAKKEHVTVAAFCGALGGLAPDLDSFIRSSTDPLLGKMFHRHFTHSLFFIPIGAAVVAFILWLIFFRKKSLKTIYFYTLLGYATHALLDTCTSYGTLLFWPLTSMRFAWDIIAIIDPLYTLPLLIGVLMTIIQKKKSWATGAFVYSLFYLVLGGVQHYRAVTILEKNVSKRGHDLERYRVMPTLGNLFLWRSIYENNNHFYVDAISLWPWSSKNFYDGEHVAKLNLATSFPNLQTSDLQFMDIKRFEWFSQNWLAIHPDNKNIIGDLRYSAEIKGVNPLWGIELTPENFNQHIKNYNISFEDRSGSSPLDYFKVE